jgi:hypothetical protein
VILVLRPQVLVPSRAFVFSLIVPALTNLIMTIDMTIANDAHGFCYREGASNTLSSKSNTR